MLTLLFLLWSLIRGLRNPFLKSNANPEAPSPEVSKSLTPSPEPEFVSEISTSRMSNESSRRSILSSNRFSVMSRDSSVDIGNESRASVTSISSFSTSSMRRYEIIGQRSMDSRASVTSLWSSDTSRRDSEAIPEHEVDSGDSRNSFSSVMSSDGSRRMSDNLANKRRRSSARSSQVRRYTRRFPLSYDRRRTTGRYSERIGCFNGWNTRNFSLKHQISRCNWIFAVGKFDVGKMFRISVTFLVLLIKWDVFALFVYTLFDLDP